MEIISFSLGIFVVLIAMYAGYQKGKADQAKSDIQYLREMEGQVRRVSEKLEIATHSTN